MLFRSYLGDFWVVQDFTPLVWLHTAGSRTCIGSPRCVRPQGPTNKNWPILNSGAEPFQNRCRWAKKKSKFFGPKIFFLGRRVFGQPNSAKLFLGFPRHWPVGKKNGIFFSDVKTRFLKGSAPLFKIGQKNIYFLDQKNMLGIRILLSYFWVSPMCC